MKLRLVAVTTAVSLTALSFPGAALAARKPAGKPAAPAVKDGDRDGMPDAYEKANGLNARKNDARADKDRDKLTNLAEYKAGTDPSKADTDGDGVRDGDDKRPRVKDPKPVPQDQKGTVTSYDAATGTLKVAYTKGPTLTVTVTAATRFAWHRKGCAAPATAASLVPGVGFHKIDVRAAKPADDEPADEPTTDQPGDEPTDDPAADRPGNDQPDADEPDDDQPATLASEVKPALTPVATQISLMCAA
ncbi:hypothetical protein [Actinoplanes sp. URMC 104]|uniref:hypothetical protein n=1 Tax=Actinoplanes sp. URMC 104 TaxID=3423409 RepID=UPI003F1E3959